MKNRNFAKMFAQFWITLAASVILAQSSVYANGGGGSDVGGGGDASEVRVNEIRSDILSWIQGGGPNSLTLPARITREQYVFGMTQILAPHSVVLGFVTTAQESVETNPELKVVVDGQLKTCRGFISETDRLPHILCNIERFAATEAADQYRLIHHEYAGLAGIEQNLGASSDYDISNQLTDYLEPVTVLRLSVTRRSVPAQSPERIELIDGVLHHPTCSIVIASDRLSREELGSQRLYALSVALSSALDRKGYHLRYIARENEIEERSNSTLYLSVRTRYDSMFYRRYISDQMLTGADQISMSLRVGYGRELLDLGYRRFSRIRELDSIRGVRKMRRIISDMPRCVPESGYVRQEFEGQNPTSIFEP